jgi:isocitrate/isopropylmalate dehydrogenase
MLEYLGLEAEAAAIEAAVQDSVATGHGTAEIGGTLGTRETGDYIAAAIRNTT